MRKPSLGDRVRRDGFFGVFEVIRVLENGSLVDIKHLDLCGPNFIESSVPTSELTFLSASRPPAIFIVPALRPVDTAKPARTEIDPTRPMASKSARTRTPQRARLQA